MIGTHFVVQEFFPSACMTDIVGISGCLPSDCLQVYANIYCSYGFVYRAVNNKCNVLQYLITVHWSYSWRVFVTRELNLCYKNLQVCLIIMCFCFDIMCTH